MLIPIYDDNPTKTFPWVTISLIVANALIFFYMLSLDFRSEELGRFVMTFGVVPQDIEATLGTGGLVGGATLTLFTSMFLHAGWLHISGNMLYLWVFGNNIEDHLGHLGFLLFYLAAGVAGSLAHIYFNSGSPIPSIGASGAIAGVLGAYLILYPRARVVTAVVIIIIIRLVSLPAIVVLGLWIVFQLFSGIASVGAEGGGVAWWAHIGGFAVGLIVALVLRKPLTG